MGRVRGGGTQGVICLLSRKPRLSCILSKTVVQKYDQYLFSETISFFSGFCYGNSDASVFLFSCCFAKHRLSFIFKVIYSLVYC